jgi:hypothetical protein
MRRYTCDRCGDRLNYYEVLSLQVVDVNGGRLANRRTWDICRYCHEFLVEFMENKNAPDATPASEDEVAPEDGPCTPGPEAAR